MRSSLFPVLAGNGMSRRAVAEDGVGPARPRRRRGSQQAGWVLVGLVVAWAASAQGQALQVDGADDMIAARFRSPRATGGPFGDGEVLRAEVTHADQNDSVAVVGSAIPQPFYGIGGYFAGGWQGVVGHAALTGAGERVGVKGFAGGSSQQNFGVYGVGQAPGDLGSTAYGVYGTAMCNPPGSCTTYSVYAAGDLVYTANLYKASDLRFKESLTPLEEALGKLLALEVVSYEHVRSEEAAPMNLPEGQQVGFVAQQVAEVLPELVGEVVHPAGNPGDKGQKAEPIRYQGLKQVDLIPYLVRALQEQQAQIEALRAQLAPLRHRLVQAGSPVAKGAGAR